MVIYLLIAVTYLLYLPKYNSLRSSSVYTRVKTHLVINPAHRMEHSAGNMLVLIHQAYKSTIDTKRETLNTVLKMVSLGTLIMAAITLIGQLWTTATGYRSLRYSHQYAYLSYRSLRI